MRMDVKLFLAATIILITIGLKTVLSEDSSTQSHICGNIIDITASTFLRLGRTTTQDDDKEDDYCNATFVSIYDMSFQIVDFLYWTQFSYVYVENELSNRCVRRFMSFSGNLTSCSELLVGMTPILHIKSALLEVFVTVGDNDTSKCMFDCNKTNMVCSRYDDNCLISTYDSVHKMISRQKYLLPSCEAHYVPPANCELIRFQHYPFTCLADCVCRLSKNILIQICNGKILISLIIYEPHATGLSFSKVGIQNISNGAFDNFHDLRSLHLDHNKIHVLSSNIFSKALVDLNALSLEGNLIRALPFDLFYSLHNLHYLDLESNLITDIPVNLFQHSHVIRGLNLSDNNIVSLPANALSPIKFLDWLYLSNNEFRELPGKVFQYTNINFLFLDNNQLEYLPCDLFYKNNLQLTLIDLSNNRLKRVPQGLLDQLKHLWFFRIPNNELFNIPEDIFNNCSALFTLHLNGNKLNALSNKTFQLPKLVILDIGYNQFEWLPDGIFDSLSSLSQLYINNNHLTYLQYNLFKSVTSLTLLSLSDNFLSKLSTGIFDTIPALRFLFLGENKLREINYGEFSNLRNLVVFDISGNKAEWIDPTSLHDLVTLDYLDLARNIISVLPNFEGLENLSILDISLNNLTNLSHSAFKGLHNLEFLNVSHNKLANLPQTTFQGLDNLISLDLSYNNLTRILPTTPFGTKPALLDSVLRETI